MMQSKMEPPVQGATTTLLGDCPSAMFGDGSLNQKYDQCPVWSLTYLMIKLANNDLFGVNIYDNYFPSRTL